MSDDDPTPAHPIEVAVILVAICAAGAGVWSGHLGEWPAVAVVVVALMALVGADRYSGVSVTRDGIEITDDEDEDDSSE